MWFSLLLVNMNMWLSVHQAYEINSTQPQYGNTTAETTVTIIIADIDDNKPAFLNTSIFQASVYENSPAGFPIAFDNFQSMVIEDLDQVDYIVFYT